MSNTKTVMSQAANTLVTPPVNVEDVFSTYLYEGTGAVRSINNGINLDGEGGLVWIKKRDSTYNHMLFDTERGPNKWIRSDSTAAEESAYTDLLDSFNSNGFTLDDDQSLGGVNYQLAGENQYASWTFRKAPKFFDVVTWTGDGVADRSIPHNLGGTVGFIAIKATSSVSGSSGDGSWLCCARKSDGSYAVGDGTSSTSAYGFGFNKKTQSYGTTSSANAATHITDSAFTVEYVTGDGSGTQFLGNTSGATYVAYLFAHNDGDGEFGPDGDADIIKCGSYTGTQSRQFIDLGFEPQWVLVKPSSTTGNWTLLDTMRGWSNGSTDATLYADGSFSEGFNDYGDLSATGFYTASNGNNNVASQTYIYIAIRRGTKVPESGTEVFEPAITNNSAIPRFASGFPVDAALQSKITSGDKWAATRLTGSGRLKTNDNDAEVDFSPISFDYQDGYYDGTPEENSVAWMWKRAPNFFDVVAYTTPTQTDTTVYHNLGVVPELAIVKRRDSTRSWFVTIPNDGTLLLNDTAAKSTTLRFTNATDTQFTAATGGSFSHAETNANWIAYLFASLDGVSKVGSYTGNGSSQTIDCGFTSGARLVLIKSTSTTGDWLIADTERGIVAGSDPYLELNTTNAEVTSEDWLDPDSSGFVVNEVSGSNANTSGVSYIFYAVA